MSQRELSGVSFTGATMVEHRRDERVTGPVQDAAVGGGYLAAFRWRGGEYQRSTNFSAESWEVEIDGITVRFRRKGPDTEVMDAPWRSADLYEIKLKAQ